MKSRLFTPGFVYGLVGVALCLLGPGCGVTTTHTKQGQSLFNGKDLSGWEGAPGWWQVKDGVLVCESTPEKPCKQSHYLIWKGGEPSDFEFRCQWRITGPANSGIQFRSKALPNFDTWGYQADIDAAGEYVGCLYQHERGLVAQRGEKVHFDKDGKRTVTTFAKSEELLKVIKAGDWNEYRIWAQGPIIKLWINGVLMCEVEDYQPRFALPKGVIALQMHQGPPMKVEFKELYLTDLSPSASAKR
ncbi:DUF1080 domain-containing protein [Fontisphaera persica]|uniref:3-keto-disaccharide hydrolase n=1 Tax=Fontisphaera persica TaxID=2974023 RepID=UPI0024C04C89|nr:DUF1080 domain-containing protein [Fontisphaera persica]WCJ60520.1 DUF1080 domain-containing protein [Fontisphaera persica]